jgi:hypothetical protein
MHKKAAEAAAAASAADNDDVVVVKETPTKPPPTKAAAAPSKQPASSSKPAAAAAPAAAPAPAAAAKETKLKKQSAKSVPADDEPDKEEIDDDDDDDENDDENDHSAEEDAKFREPTTRVPAVPVKLTQFLAGDRASLVTDLSTSGLTYELLTSLPHLFQYVLDPAQLPHTLASLLAAAIYHDMYSQLRQRGTNVAATLAELSTLFGVDITEQRSRRMIVAGRIVRYMPFLLLVPVGPSTLAQHAGVRAALKSSLGIDCKAADVTKIRNLNARLEKNLRVIDFEGDEVEINEFLTSLNVPFFHRDNVPAPPAAKGKKPAAPPRQPPPAASPPRAAAAAAATDDDALHIGGPVAGWTASLDDTADVLRFGFDTDSLFV